MVVFRDNLAHMVVIGRFLFKFQSAVTPFLEHGRLSQNLNLRFSLNFPDIKMGKKVTYCARLDEWGGGGT